MTIIRKTMTPVSVDLGGPEGNAYALLGMARQWANQLGLESDEIIKDMESSDYKHLVSVMEHHFGSVVTFILPEGIDDLEDL